MRKRQQIPQPPIDRYGRPSEVRLAWVGIALVVLAGACLIFGLGTTHTVDQADRAFSETELNRAAVAGGIDREDVYCPT